MSLNAHGVSYRYLQGAGEGVVALSDVSVVVEVGRLVLVLGATGSGKSTLMRLFAGLLRPGEGEVTLDGAKLSARSARGIVGLVFQDAESQLFADTVALDVAFGPRNLGASRPESEAVAQQALIEVGLDPEVFGSRSPFSLSGGEARRAAIAGVIAMRPTYLLADEPTAGLDAGGRRAILELLGTLKERCGIVVVTHDAEEFLEIADEVVVLREGAVAWAGRPGELVAEPDLFRRFGLIAPEVLEVQRLAAKQGRYVGDFTLDPAVAIERFVAKADL